MNKKRKPWRWIILAVIILAIALVAFLLLRPQSSSARFAEETVRSGNIETYYSFSGNVAVRDSQNILSKANATVREVYAVQDQTVKPNEALMRLSTGDVIKADISGEVTDVHVSEGDTVNIGDPLVSIVNFDDLQVLIRVDEFDVAAVSAGVNATVTIDALGYTYESTVEHISKQAISVMSESSMSSGSTFSGGDVNYYEAKLSAPEDPRILPGMKVDVRILGDHAEATTLLAMSALQFDAYNKPYVNIRDSSGSVVTKEVTVGIQDGTTVEILDGLRPGDIVLVPQSRSLFPMMDRMR